MMSYRRSPREIPVTTERFVSIFRLGITRLLSAVDSKKLNGQKNDRLVSTFTVRLEKVDHISIQQILKSVVLKLITVTLISTVLTH